MDYNEQKNKQLWEEFSEVGGSGSRFIRKQMDIAAQIDTFLRQTNWTQKKLAAEAGLRPSQISQILTGDANPTIKTIVAIEEALGKEVIVCPEFFEEDMLNEGWIRPGEVLELNAHSFSSYRGTPGSNLMLISGWGVPTEISSKHYESATTGSHHKPTG
jgi:transcriptional regulator with XRE-family HTH domain